MNPNTFYAETFVDALARAGLEAVCIAPGSRSTPLTLAFAKHDGIKKYTHLDERSAAFFALGMAMASDKPVAMVCTSGTAAANFFPAIIEANMSRIPLLVLTADRPHELRHSGANQTIDQVKLYGDHVLWSVDMALPEANPPAVAVRNLRTMGARAFATANGRMAFRRKGVVHLNFPFRKPLEPEKEVFRPETNEVTDQAPVDAPTYIPFVENDYAYDLRKILEENHNGIVVCGPTRQQGAMQSFSHPVSDMGYPILADPLSGARFTRTHNSRVITHYETFLRHFDTLGLDSPDVVLRFGNIPTSKWLNAYLNSFTPKYNIHISPDGVWTDDSHTMTHYTVSYPHIRRHLKGAVSGESEYMKMWIDVEDAARATMSEALEEMFFDGAVVAEVVKRLPTYAGLLAGNSNIVRHVDQFCHNDEQDKYVYASRGASGIDGQVSTALGIGAATGEHVYAILGDITFYHDMNGLLAIHRNGVTATIIVINNGGGGIFERLPIREHEPYYTEYFTTPHGLTFEHAAKLYGLEYAFADDFESLDAALDKYINADVSSIIEVKTNIKTDEARRKEIIEIVNQRIREELDK